MSRGGFRLIFTFETEAVSGHALFSNPEVVTLSGHKPWQIARLCPNEKFSVPASAKRVTLLPTARKELTAEAAR